MIRSLFSFTFVAVAVGCCFVSGQTLSEMKSVLSDAPEAVTVEYESSSPSQISAAASTGSVPSETPEILIDSVDVNSVVQFPAAEETVIRDTVGTTISTPTANQAYSFERDGIPSLQQRRQLRAMPIEQRPNRPLHFYGNSVRRRLGR